MALGRRKDETPPRESGLQYRLAVAVCAAVAIAVTLLFAPLLAAAFGGAEPLALYAIVFSRWGLAAVIVSAVAGFILGGERTAGVLAVVWGTHPVWSELGGWLEEHDTARNALGFALAALVVGFFWYAFR